MHLFDRPSVGDEVWDELEELLVAADVGVSTAEKLIGSVKKQVVEEKSSDGTQVRAILQAEMVKILAIDHQKEMAASSWPRVTLGPG
jgi:fused signal recognition particle receptor